MAKCANCVSESLYVYQITAGYSIEYCQRHLPKSLYSLRNSGGLSKPKVEVAAPVVEAPVKKAKKTVVEEPVVETPVVEDDATS